MKKVLALLLVFTLILCSFPIILANNGEISQKQTSSINFTPPTTEQNPQIINGTIEDNPVPLASSPSGHSWAFINLLCVLITIIFCAGTIACGIVSKFIYRNRKHYNAKIKLRLGALMITLASTILFLTTETMTLPMVLVDEHTLTMILLVIAQTLLVISMYEHDKKELKESE